MEMNSNGCFPGPCRMEVTWGAPRNLLKISGENKLKYTVDYQRVMVDLPGGPLPVIKCINGVVGHLSIAF